MFTGIVEELGRIKNISIRGKDAVISIEAKKVLDGTLPGDSIAVNGVCLTATKIENETFGADLSYETLLKSSLKNLKTNDFVNLERALTLSSRLGGHLVSGHVDCVGSIVNIAKKGSSYEIGVMYDSSVDKFIAVKGSVTLDGISLTVADIKNNILSVAVIPHTFENTNLKFKRAGAPVNIEVDIIARYIARLVEKGTNENSLKSGIYNLLG
ncbi:MAG: riboflavin synthase, alpha subunit [Deferribacteraceae bacterium]|nr:riboflavin synthase, alpha subunit [Deferribacteraceae bacterium]